MITILAGAGASYAIDNDKYPTTAKYLEKLPNEIIENDTFKVFDEYFRIELPNRVLDIELFLWEMSHVANVFESLLNSNLSLGKCFKLALSDFRRTLANVRQRPGGQLLNADQPNDSLIHFVNRLRNVQALINQNVFQLYSEPVTEDKITDNWLLLLRTLLESKEKIALFTLNYDLIPELISQTLQASNISVYDGRASRVRTTLDTSFWVEKKYTEDHSYALTTTKLHGSVDWRKTRSGQINFGNTDYSGNLDEHLLLYPGYSKITHEEPFNSFHKYFEHCLRGSATVIVIGYAFRDESVNTLLRELLQENRQARVLIVDVNSEIVHNLPEAQVSVFDGEGAGFSKNAIKTLLDHFSQKKVS